MSELLNNNIKKIEYFFFIKKVKKNIIIKKQIKAKIISIQKRFGIEQLLINVMYEVKNKIIEKQLKQYLIKKFLFTIMEQYISHYKNEKGINANETYISDKKEKIIKSKQLFNNYLIKANFYSFLNGTNICLNNNRIKIIQNSYLNDIRINKIKIYFMKIRRMPKNPFSIQKKTFMEKIFFIKIKNQIKCNKQNINSKIELTKKRKYFMNINTFKLFFMKSKNDDNYLNKDCKKEKINVENNNYINIRIEIIKKYFKLFIQKIKIKKQVNYSLKRKIFNLIKNNAKISKDIKYYLNEAAII